MLPEKQPSWRYFKGKVNRTLILAQENHEQIKFLILERLQLFIFFQSTFNSKFKVSKIVHQLNNFNKTIKLFQ